MLAPVVPVVLECPAAFVPCVRLEPLRVEHAADLFERCMDESVWRYAVERPSTVEEMRAFIQRAIDAQARGTELPFAIVELATGCAVGSTRYLEVTPFHGCLEIGWTFLGVAWQRTGANTQCKYMLLSHAFDVLNATRVQLKADARNTPSRTAIERIGGVYEGTLRKHRVLADGYIRDSAYYSVVREEWPRVRERLEVMLRARAGAAPGAARG